MIGTARSVLRFRRFERSAAQRRLERAPSVEDLRRSAKRRLPRGVFDYIDGAAEDERTAYRNRAGFSALEFRPRVLRNVGEVDISTEMLGRRLELPLVLAPTGFTRIAHPEGELAVARAAAASGVPYTLSTLGTRSIEEVASVSEGSKWFQVYMWRDRGLVRSMMERAQEAGFETLVLTVDAAVLGHRERDTRRGFTLPPKIGLGTLIDGAVHPSWTWGLLRSEPIRFANVVGAEVGDGTEAVALADYINSQFDPTMTWADVEWMRSHWPGPVVVKGIQVPDDAEIAAKEGIDAIAISNHGGRQLDDAPAPIAMLPSIIDVVAGRSAVICDGGIRRGSDIVKACALGADACMAGRAYLYGLAVAGERGVAHVLEMWRRDIARTLALCGVTSIAELTPDVVAMSR
jgi:L-lactate dehydrogenase (cytochrome)